MCSAILLGTLGYTLSGLQLNYTVYNDIESLHAPCHFRTSRTLAGELCGFLLFPLPFQLHCHHICWIIQQNRCCSTIVPRAHRNRPNRSFSQCKQLLLRMILDSAIQFINSSNMALTQTAAEGIHSRTCVDSNAQKQGT